MYSTLISKIPLVMVPQGNAEMYAIATKLEAHKHELETTVFRVGFLNDGTADASVLAGLHGHGYEGSVHLSRASMSKWILREADERKWVGGAPNIGN